MNNKIPRIDVGLFVKNGMPYLPMALRSLELQTYRSFRLIVQDARSTDGTLDVLKQYKDRVDFEVDIISEDDSGIGDAANRLFKRVKGQYFTLLDADNFYLPDHLSEAVTFHENNPKHAIYVASQYIVDSYGNPLHIFHAPPADFLGVLMRHSMLPSGSSVYNVCNMKGELRYEARFGHVPDYEYWLRILLDGSLKIHSSKKATYCTRMSNASGSCVWENYPRYCEWLCESLDFFLEKCPPESLRELIRKIGRAGIYSWANHHLKNQTGQRDTATKMEVLAESFYPSITDYTQFGAIRGGNQNETPSMKGFDEARDLLGIPQPSFSSNKLPTRKIKKRWFSFKK